MDGPKEGPDASSIKPVSSLRSRFENLQRDTGTPPASPIAGGRSPWLAPGGPVSTSRPGTASSNSNVPDFAPLSNSNAPSLAIPRPKRQTPADSRPQSMISMSPRQASPPIVKVDSPVSPGRRSMDVRPVGLSLSGTQTPRSGTDSPTRGHAKTLSRAATPGLEARMNSLFRTSEVSRRSPPVSSETSTAAAVNAKAQAASAPPPVNRAGKPKVPTKPSTLTQKPVNLQAPEQPQDVTDRSASPFNTPPGSGNNSPALARRRNDSEVSLARRMRADSDTSFVQRKRADSDASFVERVRTDSDASSQHRLRGESDALFADRARAGSNASFVEPSTLPEHHHHFGSPPVQHQIASRQNGSARTGSMPTRYRPVAMNDGSAAGDLPDDRPRLPSRPELQTRSRRTSPKKIRSGRTSPLKKELDVRGPAEGIRRAQTFDPSPQKIPASKPAQRSALAQGFDRETPPTTPATAQKAPSLPAPRRSMDRRREPLPRPPVTNGAGHSRDDEDDVQPFDSTGVQPVSATDYPDSSQASRRAPKYRQRPWEIATEYDTRTFAVCGETVCTTGHFTKAWNLKTGQQLLDMAHNEITKVTAIVFKPATLVEDEGKRLWLGTNIGEIHEVDVPTQSIVKTKTNAHTRKEIVRMFRYASELWTLDDTGELNVWKPDHKGMPSLDSQYNNFRTTRGHTFSIALGAHLWIATGKDIRVYAPSVKTDTEFQVLWNALSQPNTGDIYSGTTISSKPEQVYFGHQDGKVSIYNRHDFLCIAVVNVSVYKLSSLAGVGDYLWAGFNTGMAYVYDTSKTPWKVVKDWKAHDKQILGINADRSAIWKLDRLQVVTLGTDNMLRIWDGMLEEDWLDSQMQEHDGEYCTFREITAAVLTWNAGASKPYYLEKAKEDNNFFREYMSDPRGAPDIFVFGFQELVDLEDKKMTAKSFFKSKKKDTNELEHMSHQYRAWRDHLTKCIEDFMPPQSPYVLLHTASLVGLFTCVFVKSSLRSSIKHVHTAEVKRGMGGFHGNKGALIVRMVIDDSSICLINCHLAAGQTQTIHRNNDIAAILEAEALPEYPLSLDSVARHSDIFASGGDGSMVLDHEICILNGDLNYRIDTMGRDTVVKHIATNNLARLLERDQLLLSRKKNPGFRLRAFTEAPLTFAPTYKYNVGSDDYDSSEKRRSPAWCDRILFRGLGKVKMEEYRRWEVRVSDHRPVSGRLRCRVKRVDAGKRERVDGVVKGEFEAVRGRVWRNVQLEYLTNVLGLSSAEAMKALDG